MLVIVNWKMYLTHAESVSFLKQYIASYDTLLSSSSLKFTLCPSSTVLPLFSSLGLQYIQWGAQSCSSHSRGPYTGELSVLSLKELGVTSVIVGHSEQRRSWGETDRSVAAKVELLMSYALRPVVCIGETEQERAEKRTFSVLEKQLEALKKLKYKYPESPLVIAYEPVWSIGTGHMPSESEVGQVFSFIADYIEAQKNAVKILYGGSVSVDTKSLYAQVPFDGYLIGKQGTDGEMLKKIILLW